jgi:hypothetical protein
MIGQIITVNVLGDAVAARSVKRKGRGKVAFQNLFFVEGADLTSVAESAVCVMP